MPVVPDQNPVQALGPRGAHPASGVGVRPGHHVHQRPSHDRTAGRPEWRPQRVHVALVELFSDFREHIAIADGPNGVYRGVLSTTPRLSSEVARLTRDHAEINDLIYHLLNCVSAAPLNDGVDGVRDLGTALLVRLIRSRRASAHLVYEAYQSDIGGEA